MTILKGLIGGAIAMSVAGTAHAQAYGFASTPQGSFSYSAGSAIAKGAAMEGLQIRVIPHGGTGVSVPTVNKGEMQFVLANHNETRMAVNGVGAYDGRKQENIRAVSVLVPLRTALFVRTDSGIKTVAGLKGKRVPSVFSSQKALEANVRAILANGGMSFDDVQAVPVSNVVGSANDFAAGKVDAFFIALGAGVILQAGSKVGGVSIVDIGTDADSIANMQKVVPVAYPFPMKSGSSPGVDRDLNVMAIDFIVLTNDQLPDEAAYKMAKALHDHKAEMASSFKPINGFSAKRMGRELGFGISYHPGAVKFFKEKGLN